MSGSKARGLVPLILVLTLAGCATSPYRPWGYGEWTRGQGLVTIRVVPEVVCPGNQAPLGYRLGGCMGIDAEGRVLLQFLPSTFTGPTITHEVCHAVAEAYRRAWRLTGQRVGPTPTCHEEDGGVNR